MATKSKDGDALAHLSSNDRITVLAYLDRIMEERDRLYAIQFKAAETAVNAALAAQEKQYNATFMASQKAIEKAEEAQRDYNIRSNEFRGQLDDQAKTLMPRPESLGMFKSIEATIAGVKSDFERRMDAQAKEIAGLRESRSEGSGKSAGSQAMWGYFVAAVSVVGALIAVAVALLARR